MKTCQRDRPACVCSVRVSVGVCVGVCGCACLKLVGLPLSVFGSIHGCGLMLLISQNQPPPVSPLCETNLKIYIYIYIYICICN